MEKIFKYPRTLHLTGSKIQKGDENLNTIDFSQIKNKHIVIEEKVDGANCGISFDFNGKMYLQSRGHFLNGGYKEKQFDLFKMWANTYKRQLYTLLSNRYVIYGEWLYAKHTIYYDNLPHYFMEFDIYDKLENKFLSTSKRKQLLKDYKFIVSVLVLFEGKVNKFEDVTKYICNSNFKTINWFDNLRTTCEDLNLSFDIAKNQTDKLNFMEGLYIKLEDENQVLLRCKYIRESFINTILDSETHWADRSIIPNKLNAKFDESSIFYNG